VGGACPAGLAGRIDPGADRCERRTPKFDDPDDQLVYDFAHTYYQNHRVDDATYEGVQKRWGDKGVVDLAGLIGYYSFVSVTLNVFDVPTPPGVKLLEK
jgi:4-carboxymuconolactone decarboxylase